MSDKLLQFVVSAKLNGVALLTTEPLCSKHNRKAVSEQSPGLPRFAATLGNGKSQDVPQRGFDIKLECVRARN